MKMRPFVSVVIPTWNRAALLPDAIESVRAQAYDDMEIIVVDDGSADDTAAVLSRYGDRIRVLRQDNAGPAAARNRGIAVARGDLIAFVDSDDLWTPDALARRIDAFDRDPATQIALGQTRVTLLRSDAGGAPLSEPVAEPAFATLFGAALCRRQVFESVGLPDTALRTGEDVDWFVRTREANVSTTLVNAVTHVVRRHGGNLTLEDNPRCRGLLLAVKRSLDRRRGGGRAEVAPMRRWNADAVPGVASILGEDEDGD